MTQKKIEDKSLRMTILVNFIIVIAGIWIFSVTKIQALFLDCFFSIVSLISAIVGMILAGLSRKKTKRHPEGLYFLEPFYAIIESIIIFIVLGQSLFETGVSAYKYFVNGVGEAMNTTSVLPYTISMVILCFGIGYYNKMQNRKMNGISTMLETESKSNFIDGIQSLGIGVAILLLFIVKKDGMFGFLHYTGDFFITLCIV
ncbi:MAG: cation transporter, partial [Clostridiales bacterium]|nr:cation transporter [Clostridiales bacterium]